MAIAAIGMVVFVGLAVLAVAQIAIARTQAIAAADAAALAAAPATFPPVAGGATPVALARVLAEANGATLVSCVCPLLTTFEARRVQVTVAIPVDLPMLGLRWVHASSAAEFTP